MNSKKISKEMRSIKGRFICLRKLNLNEYTLFYTWLSDKEVVKYSLSKWQKKHSAKEIKQWLKDTLKDKTVYNFGIEENSTRQLIGYAGITGISKSNNSGEYFILIGNKNAWGKGYGTEVTKLMIYFGFSKLKLHKISLTVSEPNIGGIKAYKKAGFRKEGLLKDAAFRDGKYHNKILMSVLAS